MPQTTSKRVVLTLRPYVYSTIQRMAKAQNKPVASVISELLEEQEPLLQMMAVSFEAAVAGKEDKAKQALNSMAGKALADLGAMLQWKKEKKQKRRTTSK